MGMLQQRQTDRHVLYLDRDGRVSWVNCKHIVHLDADKGRIL